MDAARRPAEHPLAHQNDAPGSRYHAHRRTPKEPQRVPVMTTARYLIGDVFDRMAELEDGSVDLIMTSPPFLALRSYLPADHPDKAKEIGSETTPAEFIDTLLRLTAEWGRLLAPHGSICVELGDTYSGSGGGGGDYYEGGRRAGQPGFTGSASPSRDELREANARHWREKNAQRDGWPLAKSLCGIPTLYAWSLAYGRNLLTGEPSPAGKWRIRNLVAWVRPNAPVGAIGDKFRPATSFLTIACRARDRYFDLDAVRTELKPGSERPGGLPRGRLSNPGGDGDKWREGQKRLNRGSNPAGAPPLDWWNIPHRGYEGSHYAVYPPELCVRPIEAMCPHRLCTTCGQPARRILEDQTGTTVGWPDGGPGTWRPGHGLDPFAGSGTALAVAVGHGRAATGIDIAPRNADLARERIGMFLTIDHPSEVTS